MKRSRVNRILAMMLAVIMLAGMFTACGEKKPIDTLKEAMEKTCVNLAEIAIPEITAANDASVELRVNTGEMQFLQLIMGAIPEIDASVKMYIGKNGEKSALSAYLKENGLTVFDLYAYMTEEIIALDSDQLLNGKSYALIKDTIEDKFASSIFGPDGAYSIETGAATLQELFAQNTVAGEIHPDSLKLLKEMYEKMFEEIDKNLTVSEAEGSVTLGESQIATTDILISGGEIEWSAFMKEYLTYLRNDEEILNHIREYPEEFSSYALALAEGELIDYYGAVDGSADPEDIIAGYQKSIDDLLSDWVIDEETEVDENEKLNVKVNVSGDNGEIIGLNMYTEGMAAEDSVSMSLILGPSIKGLERIDLVMDVAGEVTSANLVLKNTEENGDRALGMALDVSVGGEERLVFVADIAIDVEGESYVADVLIEGNIHDIEGVSEEFKAESTIEYDYDSGEMVITLKAAEVEVGIEGVVTIDGDVTTYALESVNYLGIGIPLNGIYVVIDSSAEIPEVTDYEDILDITEDEFDAIAEKLETIVNAIAENLE